jgi:hypothetical protein
VNALQTVDTSVGVVPMISAAASSSLAGIRATASTRWGV